MKNHSAVKSKYSSALYGICIVILAVEILLESLVLLNPYAKAEPHDPGQVAVVFFHDFGNSYGLSRESLRRAEKAVELYRVGLVQDILVVGGHRASRRTPGSRLVSQYLSANRYVPENHVFTDTSSFDTVSNWENARQICEDHDWTRVVSVSSPEHLYRISQVTDQHGLSVQYAATNPGYIERLMDANYELVAWVLFLGPEWFYQRIVKFLRS